MSAELQFYNEKSIYLSEIDGGESRINYGTITPIKIRNNGTDKAKNVIISSSSLNTLDELKAECDNDEEAEKEYEKQRLASSWKSFSLTKDGIYTSELELGTIVPNSFLKGKQTIKETFSNKDNSLFQDVWSYCLEDMANGGLKIYKNQAKSQTAQRKEIAIGEKRDISIQFKLTYEYESESFNKSSCLVIFPVRIGDTGTGYILSFQFRASDGKCFFGVYKNGKGMVSNLSRTYGTRIMDTGGYLEFDQTKTMGAKIYNDDDDNIWFEFILNGKSQILYLTDNKNIKGLKLQDPKNTHPNAGLMYYDVGMYYGDLAVTISNFQITTDTDEQIVYVKSKLDGNAIDKENYKSAIVLSYIE